jgi:Kef-type K+ transport system membrane component KefB
MAGVMLSATEQQDSALHQLESIKGFFLSLFICSTGLVMSPVFLAAHMRVLAGGVLLTVLAKTVVVTLLSSSKNGFSTCLPSLAQR